MSDELWAVIAPHFPGHGPQNASGQRLFFEAVVFVLRQGLSWRALPERFGHWNTVFVRFNRYARAGVWERIFKALTPEHVAELQIDSTSARGPSPCQRRGQKKGPQAIGRSRGGLTTKIHPGICGTSGAVVGIVLTAGQLVLIAPKGLPL